MTENEILFQGKKYISSKRASEISGYAKDYVGQLCRARELKCQRVGRGWFVNVDDLLLHIKKLSQRSQKRISKEIVQISSKQANLLSLKRASKISGYTKDYLGQLCRAGELKCQRVGRGWFVNVDDLLLHIKKSPRRSQKKISKEIIQISSRQAYFLSLFYSFFPIYKFKSLLKSFKEIFIPIKVWYLKLIFPIISLIFIIIAAMGLHTYSKQVAGVTQALSKEIYAIYKDPTRIGDSLTSFSISASNKTIAVINKISQIKFNYTSRFTDWVRDIKNGFVMFPQNLKEIVRDLFNLYKEKTIIVKEKGFVEPKVREGLVVIPGIKDEDRIKTIKSSFSDEIIVKPDDEVGDSGIIQPVFKKGKGGEYIYIMVPAKKQKVETINN